jgi:hypothetical protein
MAAKDNIIIRMSAEDAGVFEAWQRAKKGPEAMGDAIEKASQKGKKHTLDLGQTLDHMVGKWVSIHAVIELARKGLEEYYKIMKENRDAEENSTRRIDTGIARYSQVQRLGTPHAREHAAQRIGQQAARARVTPEAGMSAATMLGEFGVGDDQATGEALAELLQVQNATKTTGGDPESFARRVLEIIKRSGQKVNAKSIHGVGVTARALTGKAAGFDEGIMEEYAAVSSAATAGGVDQATGLAIFAALREDISEAKRAKTQFREYMKAGMQKGEAGYRKRAAAFMAGGGDDLSAAAELQRQTLGARETGAASQKSFNEYEPGILSRQQAHDNLFNLSRSAFGKHPVQEAISSAGLSAWEIAGIVSGHSEEQSVGAFVRQIAGSDKAFRQPEYQKMLGQLLGREAIPGQTQVSVRIKGQDGRDVPHQVEAVGIQGR